MSHSYTTEMRFLCVCSNFKMYIFERQNYGEREHRDIFQPLAHSPNGYNSQSWVSLNQELLWSNWGGQAAAQLTTPQHWP